MANIIPACQHGHCEHVRVLTLAFSSKHHIASTAGVCSMVVDSQSGCLLTDLNNQLIIWIIFLIFSLSINKWYKLNYSTNHFSTNTSTSNLVSVTHLYRNWTEMTQEVFFCPQTSSCLIKPSPSAAAAAVRIIWHDKPHPLFRQFPLDTTHCSWADSSHRH